MSGYLIPSSTGILNNFDPKPEIVSGGGLSFNVPSIPSNGIPYQIGDNIPNGYTVVFPEDEFAFSILVNNTEVTLPLGELFDAAPNGGRITISRDTLIEAIKANVDNKNVAETVVNGIQSNASNLQFSLGNGPTQLSEGPTAFVNIPVVPPPPPLVPPPPPVVVPPTNPPTTNPIDPNTNTATTVTANPRTATNLRGCGNENKIIAQTLFLGASVSSFNISKGWSGQPSQLTVNLIEDDTPPECVKDNKAHKQFPPPTGLTASEGYSTDYPPDHYYTCSGADCYVTPSGTGATEETPLADRMVPGKVYCQYRADGTGDQAVYSMYWRNSDPGFFGVNNRIKPNGDYIDQYDASNTSLNKPYDLIGTPVYFKMGESTFGGIVQSWNKTTNTGGRSYVVNINGMESILSQCYVILNNFAGTVYSRSDDDTVDRSWGGPRNFAGRDGVKYWDSIKNGNIPNVFNVYGFLESLGKGGFGGARLNDDGIEANKIIDALKVLTSADQASVYNLSAPISDTDNYANYGPKSAFSPFGRILVKCMQEQDTYNPISQNFNSFGVIPPTPLKASSNAESYCQFVLDLSELPATPKDYRIAGPVVSILDLITQITEESGYDYHISLYPMKQARNQEDDSGNPVRDPDTGQILTETIFINVIKVHTISRLTQPRPNLISNTIKRLQCAGYPVSSINLGQELNETQAKHLLIGGKQQRLYQAKSLRLAYSQNSYILNPSTFQFVDYMYLGTFSPNSKTTRQSIASDPYHHGKIKIPALLSLHNPTISRRLNPDLTGLYDHDESVHGIEWSDVDDVWNDTKQLASSQDDIISGNYKKARIVTQATEPHLWGTDINRKERFFPIYLDVICPFFGYVLDTEYSLDVSSENNEFRKIRPVYFDTWTGQLLVVINLTELPLTNLDLQSFYNVRGVGAFVLTENEIRAALAGFDNFLVYSLAKTYKSDLIEMVRRAYEEKYTQQYISSFGMSPNEARQAAKDKTDWYWRLIGGNIAGAYGQTIDVSPDKGDGSASIEQEVIQDLKILHTFVSEVGQYYGKKYMVTAPSLRAYKDEQFADIALPTQAGTAFVFSGGGKLYYNYEPTNDGAWEEYGNIIDDTIPVGGDDWYNLTDDSGKIKPILGYNANLSFDYIRYSICQLSQARLDDYINNSSNDPFWNFEGYNYIQSLRDGSCNAGKFLFPGVDLSTINGSDYVVKDVQTIGNADTLASYFGPGSSFNAFTYDRTATASRDAWGKPIVGTDGNPISLKKLYLNTTVDEGFVFLDPIGLSGAKFLVDAPGLTVNSTSEEVAKDPNRTVISNVAAEDLSIYLHSVPQQNWDYEWINFMLYYTGDIHRDTSSIDDDTDMMGSYAAAANQSANFVEIAPKAIHPFFAGIPIKHNQYSYGPWTNYPYHSRSEIFPSGESVTQSSTLPPTCSATTVTIDDNTSARAINNWILPTKVDINEELVPWNYGGMASLDAAAYNVISTNLNYQSVIETAQIEMPGLPRFGLGMGFSDNALTPSVLGYNLTSLIYTDNKDNADDAIGGAILDFDSTGAATTTTTESNSLEFKVLELTGLDNFAEGPIITNIQTAMGSGGVSTTYTFRTYTPKVGLFNKIASDRLKKTARLNLQRNKQLAKLQQQTNLTADKQSRFIQEQKFQNATLEGSDLSSKLFGWSPSTVLIGQSHPYIRYPDRDKEYLEPTGLFTQIEKLDTSTVPNPNSNPFKFASNNDKGTLKSSDTSYLTENLSSVKLSESLRYKTSVGMYELKEVDAQIKKDHGLQAMMSLDGIFSPVSFYPTFKNSTFSYSIYDVESCPFCKSTKKIRTNYSFRLSTGGKVKETGVQLYCDKCGAAGVNPLSSLKSTITTSAGNQSIETLPPYVISSGIDADILLQFKALAGTSTSTQAAATTSNSSAAGVSIPINLVTLNPIVVPYGGLTNTNIQNYTGVHPEGSGVHENLNIGVYSDTNPRQFKDRCRHSIEIVGRGSVKPKNLSIHNNLTTIKNQHQVDFYSHDVKLNAKIKEVQGLDVNYQMNQRFLGLRGPLVMHGWGYDLEGYPVPNAADEPYEIDKYGRPRRFKFKPAKIVRYRDLKNGDKFYTNNRVLTYSAQIAQNEYEVIRILGLEQQVRDRCAAGCTGLANAACLDSCRDDPLKPEDVSAVLDDLEGGDGNFIPDMENGGGFLQDDMDPFDPVSGYQGPIIGKTQKWTATGATAASYPGIGAGGGKWSEKKKLKEFYLNWAERPDLWPVGPIDLRWDEGRRVWTMKSSEAATIYKMVYVTLEEDLVTVEGSEETHPARGFLDDLEYSKEPLSSGYRRLVYVKDRSMYTAPRGAKLLCRYDKNSGFYEPISKPSFVAKGSMSVGSNMASIEMSYAPGTRQGESFPTTMVVYDNPFNLPTSGGRGLFTYINGKWTLTTGS